MKSPCTTKSLWLIRAELQFIIILIGHKWNEPDAMDFEGLRYEFQKSYSQYQNTRLKNKLLNLKQNATKRIQPPS